MKNKIFAVVCVLLGLLMINSGLNKFFSYMPIPETSEELAQVMNAFKIIKWIFPLVALIEIIAGVLIIIPKMRALGALLILPVMVGIVLQHLVHDLYSIGLAVVLFAINCWIIANNWKLYRPIIFNK